MEGSRPGTTSACATRRAPGISSAAVHPRRYDPVVAGVAADLTHRLGPIEPVLARLDRRLRTPVGLAERSIADLVAFVRDGLLDPRATPAHVCALVPRSVPSGSRVLIFEGCR